MQNTIIRILCLIPKSKASNCKFLVHHRHSVGCLRKKSYILANTHTHPPNHSFFDDPALKIHFWFGWILHFASFIHYDTQNCMLAVLWESFNIFAYCCFVSSISVPGWIWWTKLYNNIVLRNWHYYSDWFIGVVALIFYYDETRWHSFNVADCLKWMISPVPISPWILWMCILTIISFFHNCICMWANHLCTLTIFLFENIYFQ